MFLGGVFDLKTFNDYAAKGNLQELLQGQVTGGNSPDLLNVPLSNLQDLLSGQINIETNVSPSSENEQPVLKIVPLASEVAKNENEEADTDEETDEGERHGTYHYGNKGNRHDNQELPPTHQLSHYRPYPLAPSPALSYPQSYHEYFKHERPEKPEIRHETKKIYNVNIPTELLKADFLDDLGNLKKLSFGNMAKGLIKRSIKSVVYRVFPSVKSLKGVAVKGCKDVQTIGSMDSILMPLGLAVTMHPLLMPLVPFLLLTLGTIKAIESATCFVSEFF